MMNTKSEGNVIESASAKAQRRVKAESGGERIRLLIVEDEEDLMELLRFNLDREGFDVTTVDTGERALEAVRQDPPDMIVLDLMLPGIDGLEVCKRLRAAEASATIPIVMLTAKGEESDVVAGLELGADDYVTKPFSPRVLAARVKAVYRRAEQAAADDEAETPGEIITVRDLTIRPDRHEVRLAGKLVDLTATEFKLLSLLARKPGRVFTRQQIIETIHGDMVAVTDRSVDVQVVSLRRKLDDGAGANVQTVRGVGYRYKE